MFVWTPAFTQAADVYIVTFTATSNDGGVTMSSTVSVPITVVGSNLPPQPSGTTLRFACPESVM